MSKPSRQEKIREWASKGAEWCATQLWTARQENSRLRSADKSHRFYNRSEEKEREHLRESNKNLAKVLQSSGIKPQYLTITYNSSHCRYEYCPIDGWDCLDCEDCEYYHEETETARKAFYTWGVTDDNHFEGIGVNFNDAELEVYRIVDETTGAVLYENKSSDDE